MKLPDISFVATERMAAEKAAQDPVYAADLARAGRVLRSHARAQDDRTLQAHLEVALASGPVDHERLAALTNGHDSAESAVKAILAARHEPLEHAAKEWLWPALTVLWERWQPEKPSFEMIDDRMQHGYEFMERDPAAACDLWLGLWAQLLRICEDRGIDTMDALDRRLRGSQSAFNWMQDLEAELWNAGLREPRYLQLRIPMCREALARFADLDELTVRNLRCAIGESLAALGERAAADAEFESLARAYPAAADTWARWAEAYARVDSTHAADVLERALATVGLRPRDELLEAACEIGERAGREDLARRARAELAALRRAPAASPAKGKKVGRNDPCPCGSGRKHKKCCLPVGG